MSASLATQIAAVEAEAEFAASYAATAAMDRLNSKGARQRAEALAAAVKTLKSVAVAAPPAPAAPVFPLPRSAGENQL